AHPPRPISAFYQSHSVQAGGRNIVNTILVNFRALDTLGEVTVLAAATLGVLAMLPRGRRRPPNPDRDESLVLSYAARVLLPLLVLLSIWFLLIGHHAPGGGFAAALVLAAAMALYVFSSPASGQRDLLRLHPGALLAAGLLLMAGSGLVGLAAGGARLGSAALPCGAPILGGLPLSTPLAFDIGVYLAAAGALLLVMRTLEERGPWKP